VKVRNLIHQRKGSPFCGFEHGQNFMSNSKKCQRGQHMKTKRWDQKEAVVGWVADRISKRFKFWAEPLSSRPLSWKSILTSSTMDPGKRNNTKVLGNFDVFPVGINTPSFPERFRSSGLWKMRNITEILSSGQNWVIWLINWLTTFPRENWAELSDLTNQLINHFSKGKLRVL
jgi:hypothetical protein